MLGRLSKCRIFSLSRASWIQWRSPSLGVSGREASWDQVWVACCVRLSIICPPIPPSVPLVFVPTPVLLSLPLSLPPYPVSVFTSLSAPISILASLPSTPLRPSVATSLPSSLSLPLPFSHLCLPASFCLSTLFLSLSLSLRPASLLSSFSLSLPHSLLSYLTRQTDQWHFTRSLYFSLVCFWFFFCLDNCPYFNSFFRDMMRQMVKQMRAGREWRAAKIVPRRLFFLVEYLEHEVNNNLACLTSKQE